jgi:hypothetical protein
LAALQIFIFGIIWPPDGLYYDLYEEFGAKLLSLLKTPIYLLLWLESSSDDSVFTGEKQVLLKEVGFQVELKSFGYLSQVV